MAIPPVERVTRLDRAVWIVSGPPILVAIAWLLLLAASAVTGRHPIWNLEPRNLAEAAAFRDGGDVVRRIQDGEHINQPSEVRAGIILPDAATMTPLEAAAGAREREMVQLLFDLGATVDANVWQRAWCISNEPDVRALLESHRPVDALNECGDRR
jgi:hypothetical protein